jgi:hypothetical protein
MHIASSSCKAMETQFPTTSCEGEGLPVTPMLGFLFVEVELATELQVVIKLKATMFPTSSTESYRSVSLPTTLLKQQTSLETLSKIATKAFTSTALQVALYIDRSPGCFVGENTVVSNGLGIGVRSRETTQGLSSAGTWLYGNLVSGNVVGALFVASDLVFVGDESNPNDFIANDIGILVTDEGDNVGTPDINYNNIEGNGVGLQNDSSQTVNAENNWWGDPDGPNVPNNPNYPTNGDTIEGTHWDIVDYDPWEPARL